MLPQAVSSMLETAIKRTRWLAIEWFWGMLCLMEGRQSRGAGLAQIVSLRHVQRPHKNRACKWRCGSGARTVATELGLLCAT